MSEFIDYVFQRSTSLNKIDNSLYSKYNVKNGLRNEDGTGVLVGLTKISDVVGYKKENDKKIDTEGELYYRGVKVSDFIKGHDPKNRFLFEEACFLILFGYLPNKDELDAFKKELASRYDLPLNYLQARILGSPKQKQLMVNALQENNHTVAMTGDGVNDVLALKAADCSIAMASGSDAAKSASHIVLLKNNFNAMPHIVNEGRALTINCFCFGETRPKIVYFLMASFICSSDKEETSM